MPITLEDIARMRGVSRSTVSRVINGQRLLGVLEFQESTLPMSPDDLVDALLRQVREQEAK